MQRTMLQASPLCCVLTFTTVRNLRQCGIYDNVLLAAFNPDAEDNDAGDAMVRDHTRGMTTFVFVPWDGVASSELNKGIEEMDIWLPG